jgi:serine/threonine protein kinase
MPKATYTKDRVIGRGASGLVYRAYDPHGRPVAIKRIRCCQKGGVPSEVVRELRHLKYLRHPNIVSVRNPPPPLMKQLLDAYGRDGKVYLVFEYLPWDLTSLIDDVNPPPLLSQPQYGATLPLGCSRAIVKMVLKALVHVHAHGAIHRVPPPSFPPSSHSEGRQARKCFD